MRSAFLAGSSLRSAAQRVPRCRRSLLIDVLALSRVLIAEKDAALGHSCGYVSIAYCFQVVAFEKPRLRFDYVEYCFCDVMS